MSNTLSFTRTAALSWECVSGMAGVDNWHREQKEDGEPRRDEENGERRLQNKKETHKQNYEMNAVGF